MHEETPHSPSNEETQEETNVTKKNPPAIKKANHMYELRKRVGQAAIAERAARETEQANPAQP